MDDGIGRSYDGFLERVGAVGLLFYFLEGMMDGRVWSLDGGILAESQWSITHDTNARSYEAYNLFV